MGASDVTDAVADVVVSLVATCAGGFAKTLARAAVALGERLG